MAATYMVIAILLLKAKSFLYFFHSYNLLHNRFVELSSKACTGPDLKRRGQTVLQLCDTCGLSESPFLHSGCEKSEQTAVTLLCALLKDEEHLLAVFSDNNTSLIQ